MIRINLLSQEEKTLSWQVEHFFAMAVFFFFVSLGSVWSYLIYAEQQLAEQLQQTHQQQELLKPTLIHMKTANARQQAINDRQMILITLTQERPPIYAAVARLGALIPDGVWLTDVASDKKTLKVTGVAKNYPELAAFMKKIQEVTDFTDFTLVRTEQEKMTTKFEVTVKFKGM